MITLRTYRDEARFIQEHFFPFLLEICRLRMRDATLEKDSDKKLVWRMMLCLALQVKKKYDKKLLTEANRFAINLTDAEAICFYQLLMAYGIDTSMIYEIKLRQQIITFLHGQLVL